MTFYYLATPYSKYPWGLEEAYRMACRQAALLAKVGVPVFSPIAHGHGLSMHGKVPALDHDLWMRLDEPFMAAAHGLIVVMAPTWEESRGLTVEVARFDGDGKPVIYMDLNTVPAEFL